MPKRPLWKCPSCGRRFANANQWHSCGSFSVRDHLGRPGPEAQAIYESLVRMLRTFGPVEIVPTKTRIGFQVRMTFAGAAFKRGGVELGFVLARRIDDPRFLKAETYSPRNHLYQVQLVSVDDLDDQVEAWLREAYDVGRQKHLESRPISP